MEIEGKVTLKNLTRCHGEIVELRHHYLCTIVKALLLSSYVTAWIKSANFKYAINACAYPTTG